LTGAGGEGMVVKPLDFLPPRPQVLAHSNEEETADEAEPKARRAKNEERWTQPALKVRGREYLRLIYGPEYARPENIERLRARALGGKRGLALREWGLGLESLERFVAREPLRRVHECAFAVLALESSPVDPRL
jgi:protein phosphatase